jgi:RHS repeat-associated protein
VTQTDATDAVRFGFDGMEYDSVTGLYYDHARYYDAAIGRFVSQDPKGFAAGDTNLYRYVGNEPTVRTDTSGLDWWGGVGGATSGGIIGGGGTATVAGVLVLAGTAPAWGIIGIAVLAGTGIGVGVGYLLGYYGSTTFTGGLVDGIPAGEVGLLVGVGILTGGKGTGAGGGSTGSGGGSTGPLPKRVGSPWPGPVGSGGPYPLPH